MKPLFSIIIPTYNRAKTLDRALNSIANQIFHDFEVIVSDDGSTDETKTVVDKYLENIDIKYVWGENWGGPARPRNKGLKIAKGEWVCFLDSDDWWYPNKLEQVFKNMHKGDVIYHDLDVYMAQGKKSFYRDKGRRMKHPVINDLMTRNNRIYNSSFSVKKELLDKTGGVCEDKSLVAAEDFDLWIRISKLTDSFLYIPMKLGAYWLGDDNISEVSEKQISIIKAVYKKNIPSLSANVQKEAFCFMNYSIGRIQQKLGLGNEARECFKSSFKSKRLNLKMKSLLCFLLNHYLCGKSKSRCDKC